MTARRPATDAEARALASSLRLRILRVCLDEPHTNKEIAAALQRDPASTLHHVRRLVDTGFLDAQPDRRGARGAREVPYLATGKSWRIQTPARDQALLDAFLEEVALVPLADLETVRLGLRLSEAGREEFLARLGALLEDFRARPSDPAAPAWSLFVALHPDVTRERAARRVAARARGAQPVEAGAGTGRRSRGAGDGVSAGCGSLGVVVLGLHPAHQAAQSAPGLLDRVLLAPGAK